MSYGVLAHVYHLEVTDWERLVWGDPQQNRLGTLTKLTEVLLRIPLDGSVHTVVYSGPSSKGGLNEGEYTKAYVLRRLDELTAFPRLQQLLAADPRARSVLRERLQAIYTGPIITNTAAEVRQAAAYFTRVGAEQIVQVAAASHAPRCMQNQVIARDEGVIPPEQYWETVASDICFAGTTAADVVVIEPPHRADDPMLGAQPGLAAVLRPYFSLPAADKKQVITAIAAALQAVSGNREGSA